MLLLPIREKDQPYFSMLATNSLIKSLRAELSRHGCELPLHIRWKHDILLDNLKLGEIALKHAKVEERFYTQLSTIILNI